jgi:nucleotide-binding universal stress UspA family protein
MKSSSQSAMVNDKVLQFPVHQILVALGLEKEDKYLLDYLHFLTLQLPFENAHFLHVLPSLEAFNTILKEQNNNLISNLEINEEVLLQMREEIQQSLDKNNIENCEIDIREGNPLEEILKDAREVNPNILVAGQKADGNNQNILARNLVRKSGSDVLVVPKNARHRLKKLLVPIDFSAYSLNALKSALAIREQLKGEVQITCVHLYKMPDLSIYRIQKTYQQLQKMVQADHLEAMQAFIAEHAGKDAEHIELKVIVQEEPGIAHYLVDTAHELQADMMVMGAKGYSKVELLLIGSVTEKVLSLNDQIPTLVVR